MDSMKTVIGLFDDFPNTRTYGRICLSARRMIERGVRFIELTCPGGNGDRWDQHGNLPRDITSQCYDTDQPTAALINDLKQRGLLDRFNAISMAFGEPMGTMKLLRFVLVWIGLVAFTVEALRRERARLQAEAARIP